MQLDIVDFYPSISEQLLQKAISFAQTKVDIDPKIIDVILHARKSLLFTSEGTWVKKDGNLFDVTMGSYDGAEVCELVGLYLIDQMASKVPEINFGLYRDDGLGSYVTMPGPQTERTRNKASPLQSL